MRFLLLLPLLAACADDVAKDKTAAAVSEPPPAAPAAAPSPAPAGGKALALDAGRSRIGALGAKITGKHDVKFPTLDGTITLDGEAVTGIAVNVQVGALVADAEKLTAHLKSPDFFEVEAHPTATFTATEVKASPARTAPPTPFPAIAIRGVTKRVSFPATVTVSPTEVTGRAEFAINRKDFGIVYPGKPDDLIQDNVLLTIELVAPRS